MRLLPPHLPLSGRSLTVKNLNARVPLPLPRTCVLDEACEPAHLTRLLMIDAARPYHIPLLVRAPPLESVRASSTSQDRESGSDDPLLLRRQGSLGQFRFVLFM